MDFCVPYFDDILIVFDNETQHVQNLEKVFQRFAEYGVNLNAAKCVREKTSVTFVGHIITADGVTVKELRRFLE